MTTHKFHQFSQYILRTPAFPLSFYTDLLEEYALNKAILSLNDNFFKESILLASPELLEMLEKLKENPQDFSAEKKEALSHTLLKYLSRIATRCTPFGLFAGCTVGEFSSETNVVLQPYQQFTRFTQFDMHFWIAFLQRIEKMEEYRNSLTYYANQSIYAVGDFYRFIEYKYQNGKREHAIAALRQSELLEQVVQQVQNGSTVAQLTALIASDDSELEEAREFINQLIDFQFLTSELEAGVTGTNEFERVVNILKKFPHTEKMQQLLQFFETELGAIDQSLCEGLPHYQKLKKTLEKNHFEFESKFLFQTDLNLKTETNTLNHSISKKLVESLTFLNGIQKNKPPKNLTQFKNAFVQRYETREMPLVTVLDTETGIGYPQKNKNNDAHSILDSFSFPANSQKKEEETWTELDHILEKKLENAVNEQQAEIILSEKDFPYFDANFETTPPTFSVIAEIVEKDDNALIAITSSGNNSASNLLGRFCNGNQNIHQLTREIVAKEKAYYHDKIVAEIVHIPESRTGNILRRPVLRDYEIPYLANSGVSSEFQIPITDLMISIDKNRVVLRSKKHNKEVIPFLSNAHNYISNSLPIYHFLCDLQHQDIKPIYGFGWGVLEKHYSYFPRVKHKEVLLSKARWIVSNNEIAALINENQHSFHSFTEWKTKRNIPRYVNWLNYDNTLLLDFEQEICISLFLNSVKKFPKIILEEFLFTENSVVKNENKENFTNQFIVSFYKETL